MNNFVMFDFETDGKDPETCNPVQLAAVMINPYSLKVVSGSEFCSDMKPANIMEDDYETPERLDTIRFHMKNQNKTKEEVLERWRSAPSTELVWKNFIQYVNKYNPKKTQWTSPVAAGMNIRNFDLPICRRLNDAYKTNSSPIKKPKYPFNHEVVDLRDIFYVTLVWDQDLKSRSMDNIRKYMGMSSENAHDALQDVKDCANILIRYLKYFKNVYEKKNPYKGCMKNV